MILANAAVLGLETYDSVARDAGGLLDTLNDVFLAIFVVELAIRLVGFGSRPQDFFKSGWNVFDFDVVAARTGLIFNLLIGAVITSSRRRMSSSPAARTSNAGSPRPRPRTRPTTAASS